MFDSRNPKVGFARNSKRVSIIHLSLPRCVMPAAGANMRARRAHDTI
jgi:hypothetical protein